MSFVQSNNCLHGPKQVFKLIAVVLCFCVACYQLSGCVSKILRPPISSHYSFNLNNTLSFPAVTICRSPPYKTSLYQKYGMSSGGPKYPTAWRNFNFTYYTIDQFFEEATFSITDILPFYGFDGYMENVTFSSLIIPAYGRCFVVTPNNDSTLWSSTGYYFYFSHTETVRTLNNNGISVSGYHIYIHDTKEVFAGGNAENENSLMDYLYLENGEELRLNLKVKSFEQLPTKENWCNDSYSYSQIRCRQKCLYERLSTEVGCSTPWIKNDDLPSCDSYAKIYTIMKLYNLNASSYVSECDCPPVCHLRVYTPYIQNIKDVDLPTSQLSMSFSANLVTKMTEVLGYDWNLFLSDLGGSLGFLLGISVVGLIGTFEHIITMIKKNNENMSLNKTPANEEIVEKKLDNKELKIYLNDRQLIGDMLKGENYKNMDFADTKLYVPRSEKHDFASNKY